MCNIDFYLNDMANYKCQMILCYLRGRQYDFTEKCRLKGEDFAFTKNILEVGQFENYLKTGYIFGLKMRHWTQLADKWMVVEDSSSDSIYIRHFRATCINTPSIDVTYDDGCLVEEKWFGYDEVMEAAEYILMGMNKCVDDYLESDHFKNIVEKHKEKFGNDTK